MEELLPAEGWEYQAVEAIRDRPEYLLSFSLRQSEAGGPGEARILLDEADPQDFHCLQIRDGKARLLRIVDGFQAGLEGETEAALGDVAAELRLEIARMGDSWVVRWDGQDRLFAMDAEPKPGPVRAAARGSLAVGAWRVQPLGMIYYRDDFTREAFAPNGLYEVRGTGWQIRKGQNTQKTVNAFQAFAQGGETIALNGLPFWRHVRVSASLLYEGPGKAGLVWGASSTDRLGLVRWERAPDGQGSLSVLERSPDGEQVLASVPWVPRVGQWYRLNVQTWGDQGTVTINGEEMRFRVPPSIRAGKCGLYAESAEGIVFDDVAYNSVKHLPETDSAPKLTPMLKERTLFGEGTVDYKDHGIDTWRYDQSSWEKHDRTLRQRTWFWGDVRATASLPIPRSANDPVALTMLGPDGQTTLCTVGLRKDGERVIVTGADEAEPVAFATAEGQQEAKLVLWRANGEIKSSIDGQPMHSRSCPDGAPVGISFASPNADPKQLEIEAAHIADSVFDHAPTEWVRWRGEWGISSKWQCKPEWTYMSLYTDRAETMAESAGAWTVDAYSGDQDLQFYVALKDMLGQKKDARRYVRRDMNFAFCGDGKSLDSGYCVLFGGFGNRGTQLLRNGKIVAENTAIHFPPFTNTHHDIHWVWWYCRITRQANTITFSIDNQEVLRYDDPDPLPGGHVGLWTVGNGLIVTRTRFTWEEGGTPLAGFDESVKPEKGLAGWETWPADHSVQLTPLRDRPDGVQVTNSLGGGPFGVVLGEKGVPPTLMRLAYRVPPEVTINFYGWDGKDARPIENGGTRWGALQNDGRWHEITLPAELLRHGERFAVGYDEEDGYISAGLGANRLGASYFLQTLPPPPRPENVHVSTSSTHREWPGEGPPEAVMDGNPATRWSSDYHDGEEVVVDLGKEVPLHGLRVLWEKSAAKRYSVRISPDGRNWETVAQESDGKEGPRTDELSFAQSTVRFVRLDLAERVTEFGFSLYEIEIVQ